MIDGKSMKGVFIMEEDIIEIEQPIINQTEVAAPVIAEVNLVASKIAVGASLPSNLFNFRVMNEAGDIIKSATNNADGGINFPPILLTTAGMYHYTIREEQLIGGDWITDSSVFPVTVIVTQKPIEEGGGFNVEIQYPNGNPVFVNIHISERVICPTIGYQKLDMCVPVRVKPFANINEPRVRCCGRASMRPGTEQCDNMPVITECGFTINQSICVEIPVEFGADVETGELHGTCNQVSEDNICVDC